MVFCLGSNRGLQGNLKKTNILEFEQAHTYKAHLQKWARPRSKQVFRQLRSDQILVIIYSLYSDIDSNTG